MFRADTLFSNNSTGELIFPVEPSVLDNDVSDKMAKILVYLRKNDAYITQTSTFHVEHKFPVVNRRSLSL